ncbi:MAG: pyridine nucleotide-disulfide oxidoreductase [Clostridia bacterium]|jgi:sarcosine oxidase subunit alpha|nr:pyridine nucleotide-disulfide oxidoreductase [Clostridia bacterium]
MLHTEIAIIGGGPAGMCAAIAAAGQGARVTLFDRGKRLGGQLVKQTHRFFGSEKEYAGTRGVDIAKILYDQIEKNKLIDVKTDATVLAFYNDGVITYEEGKSYKRMTSEKTIIAAGAAEKMLLFSNNDLPGVYGAGAVQTLMNEHGIVPGNNVLMVGAGNIGLIVSYQLMQAGVKVKAIIDAAPKIGGFLVHASKVRRLGVPILTSHTIKEAVGKEFVEGAVICELDEKWQPIPGADKKLDVDIICLAVGLSPQSELLRHTGCDMKYVPSLGGYVPLRDENLQTTASGVYVAGDSAEVEEASSAMVEGTIAGLSAAEALGYGRNVSDLKDSFKKDLNTLRAGAVGEKIRSGLKILNC